MADDKIEVKPYRVQLNMTAAHSDPEIIEDMLLGLSEDAEHRGLFMEWGYMEEMDPEDVMPDSPLQDLLTGGDDDGLIGLNWHTAGNDVSEYLSFTVRQFC